MKCPKCGGKKVQCTNMGKQSVALVCSFILGIPISIVSRSGGIAASKSILRSMCPMRDYICLNPDCKHMFSEPN